MDAVTRTIQGGRMIQIDFDKPARCIECPLCVDYDCILQTRIIGFNAYDLQEILREQYRHCPLIPENPHNWCTDCNEYDHERHCCPRFRDVIFHTVNELTDNAYIEGYTAAEAKYRKLIGELKQ